MDFTEGLADLLLWLLLFGAFMTIYFCVVNLISHWWSHRKLPYDKTNEYERGRIFRNR